VEQKVFQGLKQGNSVLTELQKEMSLDEVEKLMADTAEAIEYQNVHLKGCFLADGRKYRPCLRAR